MTKPWTERRDEKFRDPEFTAQVSCSSHYFAFKEGADFGYEQGIGGGMRWYHWIISFLTLMIMFLLIALIVSKFYFIGRLVYMMLCKHDCL